MTQKFTPSLRGAEDVNGLSRVLRDIQRYPWEFLGDLVGAFCLVIIVVGLIVLLPVAVEVLK